MLGFFGMIFGLFYFIIRGGIETGKRSREEVLRQSNVRDQGIKSGVRVSIYSYDKDCHAIYRENTTMRRVVKVVDKDGIKRWMYADTGTFLEPLYNGNGYERYKIDRAQSTLTNKKWSVIQDFWEISIEREGNRHDYSPYNGPNFAYLDDYTVCSDFVHYPGPGHDTDLRSIYSDADAKEKAEINKYFYDNNPLNQKIYFKNNRPYQLSCVYKRGWHCSNIVEKKQYLIRFGKYYDITKTYNIKDKYNNRMWTKWYAITEDDYYSLTNLKHGSLYIPGTYYQSWKWSEEDATIDRMKARMLKEKIAYKNGLTEPDWDSNDPFYGIEAAFDENGNFIRKE